MSPSFHRGRFFTLAPSNIGISSRFNSVPIIMEKSDLLEKDRSDFNRYAILPNIGNSQNGRNNQTNYLQPSIDNLYARLPRDYQDLPSKALDLTPEEDDVLAAEVCKEMSIEELQNLKDAYTQMANTDTNLDGLTDFTNVQRALSKNKIFLPPPLLRLVAARCLSSRIPWKVNYERLISFLGTAKKNENSQTSNITKNFGIGKARTPRTPDGFSARDSYLPPRQSLSPQQSIRSHGPFTDDGPLETRLTRPMDYGQDRPGITNILRDLKFNQDFRNVDMNALRSNFQRADAMHRGALSEQQIKDICTYCGLPLDDALASKIIHTCPYKGGGQYDWQEFLRILERVQPQATGLIIPRSRRPLEMARHSHEASSEWPHGNNVFTSRSNNIPSRGSRTSSLGGNQPLFRESTPTPRATAPARSDYYTQNEYRQPDTDFMHQQQQEQQFQPPPPQQQQFQPPPPPQQQFQPPPTQQQQFQPPVEPQAVVPSLPLAPLSSRYESGRASVPLPPAELSRDGVNRLPWLDRFIKLVDSLYAEDRNKTGYLDATVAWRIVYDYNHAYMLDLNQDDIDQAFAKCVKQSTGRIDINAMLRLLGAPK